jgi:hypothetical protein
LVALEKEREPSERRVAMPEFLDVDSLDETPDFRPALFSLEVRWHRR